MTAAPATITPDTKFVYEVLVTDTRVYEIVERLDRKTVTLKLRATRDAGPAVTDERCDKGAYGLSVVHIPQEPDPTAPVRTVRLRQDGTFRVSSWCALRPCSDQDHPARRVDYRV
jgi:hypothetical protein